MRKRRGQDCKRGGGGVVNETYDAETEMSETRDRDETEMRPR